MIPGAVFRAKTRTYLQFVICAWVMYAAHSFCDFLHLMYVLTPAAEIGDIEISGYPAGDDFVRADSSEERLSDGRGYYTFTVDASDLTPTSLYKDIDTGMGTKDEDDDEQKLRIYIAKLESGESILVLLNAKAIGIPDSGTITLPAGGSEIGMSLTDQTITNSDVELD